LRLSNQPFGGVDRERRELGWLHSLWLSHPLPGEIR
jgi:hypothetical protein